LNNPPSHPEFEGDGGHLCGIVGGQRGGGAMGTEADVGNVCGGVENIGIADGGDVERVELTKSRTILAED
jgi:hypothetical protein